MHWMKDRVVYFNGRYVAERDARLSIYDSGLLRGEIAFEVTRTVRHRPLRLDAHIERLYHSLAGLRIDPGMSPAELRSATEETLDRNLALEGTDVDWNIIHNVSRGPSPEFADAFELDEFRPSILISCYPLVAKLAALAVSYTQGLDLIVPPQRSIPHELLDCSLKTRSRVHYQIAKQQAEEIAPNGTAVMIDPAGFLTEGTSGNVFVVRQGRLETPEPRDLLPGVTRHLVLELASNLGLPCRETDITPEQAESAEEMFVTSTTIGILHARSLNGRRIGAGTLGPLTARLRDALHELVGLDLVQQARDYAAKVEFRE
jgi:branched-chain amino acid aminotransferase